jgi:hypothetical protein
MGPSGIISGGDAKRISQVPQWLGNLADSVTELETACSMVEDRTGTVAVQNPPIAETNKNQAPDECLVPVADTIREQVWRIDGARLRLRGLAGRIEL